MSVPSHYTFYEDLLTGLDATLLTYVNDTASDIAGEMIPIAAKLLLIYVMFWGWSMMRGIITEPVTDAINRIMRLTLIVALGLNLTYYSGIIVNFLFNSPDYLAGLVASGHSNTTSNMQFLDSIFSQMFDLGEKYNTQADAMKNTFGVPELTYWAMSWFIWVAGALLTLYAAAIFILAKLALSVLLALGVIFVMASFFEPTRKFTDSWVGQCLTFVFMVMLTAAVLKLLLEILSAFLTSTAGMVDPPIVLALKPIVYCAIGLLVLLQVGSISSALGGGMAISTLGAVGWAYNKMMGSLGAAKNAATGKTLSDYRAQRRQKANNARWAKNNPNLPSRIGIAAYKKFGGGKNKVAQG